MFKRNFILLAVIMNMAVACKNAPKNSDKDSLLSLLPATEQFRDTIDGKPTDLHILKNKKGMYVAITNFGGRNVSLVVPDKSGKPVDVIVGSGSLKDFYRFMVTP